MEYNFTTDTKVHTNPEKDPISGSKNTENQSRLSFMDTLSKYLPESTETEHKQLNVYETIEKLKLEKRKLLNMLLQEFRANFEAKRLDLLEKLLSTDKKDDEDPMLKCLRIFKKLLRGEKVSPEEMKFLMQFAPMLYLMVQLLKDDDFELNTENREDENTDQSTELENNKNVSSLAEAIVTYTPDTSAAAS